jgi:thiol-disulfide isomerase/thioredoxin
MNNGSSHASCLIIGGILVAFIIILLIMNYQKSNQINALKVSLNSIKEPMGSCGKPTDMPSPSSDKLLSNQVIPNSNAATLYLFYTNWCGHSLRFLPIWDQFGAGNSFPGLNIQKVDCEKSDLCNKFNVKGFPMVKLVKVDGSVTDFNGPRTIDGLNSFVSKNL